MLRSLTRETGRKPLTPEELLALQQELRAVREQCVQASRRGDYLTQGLLTVQAARLNEAIAQAQQIAA